MNDYIVTKIDGDKRYDQLISLTDYEIPITTSIKTIKLPNCANKMVLIDTSLCSGITPYRFIETTVDECGTMNLSQHHYVRSGLDPNVVTLANKVLAENKIHIDSSILTTSQIKKVINNTASQNT